MPVTTFCRRPDTFLSEVGRHVVDELLAPPENPPPAAIGQRGLFPDPPVSEHDSYAAALSRFRLPGRTVPSGYLNVPFEARVQ